MKKLLLGSIALVMIVLALAGCGKTTSSSSATTKELTFNGQTYTVPKDPQKIAVLSNSVLSMLYAVDGKAISRANTTDKLAPELEALPALGQTANINMEQLLGLKPDVVLGLVNQHKKYESQLQANNIPTVLFDYDGIKDNVPMLTFLGELTNHQDKAKSVITTYENNITKIKDAVKNQQPARVAVLRATGKGVTAETDEAVTASMVKELGNVLRFSISFVISDILLLLLFYKTSHVLLVYHKHFSAAIQISLFFGFCSLMDRCDDDLFRSNVCFSGHDILDLGTICIC